MDVGVVSKKLHMSDVRSRIQKYQLFKLARAKNDYIFNYTYFAHIFSGYVIDYYTRSPETLFLFSICLSIRMYSRERKDRPWLEIECVLAQTKTEV